MRVARLAAVLAMATPAANANPSGFGALTCHSPDRVYALPDDRSPVTIRVEGKGAVWLEIEERGAELESVAALPEDTIEITVPPRYGRFVFASLRTQAFHVRRATHARTPAAAHAVLHCAPAPERIAWYRRSAELAQAMMPVPREIPNDALLADIDALRDPQAGEADGALVLHLRAQAFFLAGRAGDSAPAFAEAEASWLAAGDTSRALAARVGRVEDLLRAGEYRTALRLSSADLGNSATDGYFQRRLGASRCLAWRYLGDTAHAARCYDTAIAAFASEGERAELASMEQDFAYVLHMLGKINEADRYIRRVFEDAEGPDAPILRGRARLLAADLALDRGDPAAALGEIDRALGEFNSVNAVRWEANAMLRAATLYSALGAVEEAYAFLDEAFPRFNEKDAPARLATADLTRAEIDIRAARLHDAIADARSAEKRYGALGMTVERDAARAVLTRALLASGAVGSAEELIDAPHAPSNGVPWRLLRARLLVETSDPARARRELGELGGRRLRFEEEIERAELEGAAGAREGGDERAARDLFEEARRVRRTAQRLGNPLLRELTLRLALPLRARAADLIIARAQRSQSFAVDAAWQWIAWSSLPSPADDARRQPIGARRFDEAVARDLLIHNPAQPRSLDSARHLLPVLAANGATAAQPASATLTGLQEKLGSDAYVAYLEGNVSGAFLWVTRDTAQLIPAPAGSDLRPAVAALNALVSDPASSTSDIHAAATALSRDVFARAPFEKLPTRLLVDATGVLGAMAWSVLTAPDDGTQLVEHTAIDFVRYTGAETVAKPPAAIHVVASGRAATANFPELPSARMEARVVASALGRRIALDVLPQGNRETLMETFSHRGDWVHVAAHGEVKPGAIGYNGLWLDPEPGTEQPTFLSGIDVLDSGVRSELVVLAACRLGSRGDERTTPALSFADAVSRSGARHVVAALWPVSDSASTLWTATFYRSAVSSDFTDVAGALREAQLGVRRSRSYRHPYYWASWIHLQIL